MVARWRDGIQYDTRANQPAATTVDVGTLYYVTDEDVMERGNGSTWAQVAVGATGALDWGETGDISASDFGDSAAAGATGEAADAGHVHSREANPVTAHLSAANHPDDLGDLDDVDDGAPDDGDVLTWNDSLSQWEPAASLAITSDTAWAAKGDLIVADADDSAQVLSVGTNDQVLTADSGEATGMKWAAAGSGLTTGTSFPGSPSTGDRYRRTDLDYAIYFYDGTRWLSEVEYSLSTFVLNTWEPTSSHYAYLPVPQDADIYVERFDAWGWLSSSGDWDVSITCKTAASAATWTSSVATFANSSVRPSITTTIGQVCSGSSGSDAYLQVRIEEQSGSANFKNSVTIYFRRIAT